MLRHPGEQAGIAIGVGEIRHGLLRVFKTELHFPADRLTGALQRVATSSRIARIRAGLHDARGEALIHLQQRGGDVRQLLVQPVTATKARGDPRELRAEDAFFGRVTQACQHRRNAPQVRLDFAQGLTHGQGIAFGALEGAEHTGELGRQHPDHGGGGAEVFEHASVGSRTRRYQPVALLELDQAGRGGQAARDDGEQVAVELFRWRASGETLLQGDQLAEFLVDLAQAGEKRLPHLHAPLQRRVTGGGAGLPHQALPAEALALGEGAEHTAERVQPLGRGILAQHTEQLGLEALPCLAQELDLFFAGVGRGIAALRSELGEFPWKHRLRRGQRGLAARGTERVGRFEHIGRQFALLLRDTTQVGGQLHPRREQYLQGVFGGRNLSVEHGLHGELGLACQLLGAGNIEHPQRGADLVRQRQRVAQPGGLGEIVGKAEQLCAQLTGRLLDLAGDPLQGHEIPLHSGLSCHCCGHRARPLPRPSSGKVNPATELRSSLVMPASLPIDCAVAVVPAEVCEVISWMMFMVFET